MGSFQLWYLVILNLEVNLFILVKFFSYLEEMEASIGKEESTE